MLPPPPGFSTIIAGIIYGCRVATAQVRAGDPNAHRQDVAAVWDALWASWLISLGCLEQFIWLAVLHGADAGHYHALSGVQLLRAVMAWASATLSIIYYYDDMDQ